MRKAAAVFIAAATISCGAVVAGYPLLLSGSGLIVALGGLGLASLAIGLFATLPAASIIGAGLLVAEYLIALFLSGSSFDFLSAPYAVMLLLLIELVDLAESWRAEPPLRAVGIERIRYLITVVAVGALVAWLAAIAGAIVNSSFLLLVLGALGGIGAIAVPLYFARDVLASDDNG